MTTRNMLVTNQNGLQFEVEVNDNKLRLPPDVKEVNDWGEKLVDGDIVVVIGDDVKKLPPEFPEWLRDVRVSNPTDSVTYIDDKGVVKEVKLEEQNVEIPNDAYRLLDWGQLEKNEYGNYPWHVFKLTSSLVSVPNYFPEYLKTIDNMFSDPYVKLFPEIINWDLSGITYSNKTFSNRDLIKEADIISKVRMPNNTSLTSVFENSKLNFNDVKDLINWEELQYASRLFHKTQFGDKNDEITKLTMGELIDTDGMFSESNFNEDISNWRPVKANRVNGMFRNNTSFNQDLSGWEFPQINIKPTNFDEGASSWELPRPSFGLKVGKPMIVKQESGNLLEIYYNGERISLSEVDWKDPAVEVVDWGEPDESIELGDYFIIELGKGIEKVPDYLPKWITNISQMFFSSMSFNDPNITKWDFSHVTAADNAFLMATSFNQDLSHVRFELIPEKPFGFDDMTRDWEEKHKPKWGTDDTLKPIDDSIEKGFIKYRTEEDGEIFKYEINENTNRLPSGTVEIVNWGTLDEVIDVEVRLGADILKVPNHGPSWTTDYSFIFKSAKDFNDPNVCEWDVSHVKNMVETFSGARSFNQDIGDWDVSNVTDMSYMFTEARSFNQDIGDWDVSNVIEMRYMFYGCSAFNQDLSYWDVSRLTTKPNGFDDGANNWLLSRPIWGTKGKWEPKSKDILILKINDETITISDKADLEEASPIVTLDDISKHNRSGKDDLLGKVIIIKTEIDHPIEIVHLGENIEDLDPDIKGLIISGDVAFSGERKEWMEYLEINKGISYPIPLREDQPIVFDSENKLYYILDDDETIKYLSDRGHIEIISMTGEELIDEIGINVPDEYLDRDISFLAIEPPYFELISFGSVSLNTFKSDLVCVYTNNCTIKAHVEKWMKGLIIVFSKITTDFLEKSDTSKLEYFKFFLVDAAEVDFEGQDLRNIISFDEMFHGSTFRSIKLNDRDMLPVGIEDFRSMFYLTNIFDEDNNSSVIDLSGLDTSSAKDMSYMFCGLNDALNSDGVVGPYELEIIGIEDLDTSNVVSMEAMFAFTKRLNVDISGWDVSNVRNMDEMFEGSEDFNQDLSRWDVYAIPEEPKNFSKDATNWTLPKPKWGFKQVSNLGNILVIKDGEVEEIAIPESGVIDLSGVRVVKDWGISPLRENVTIKFYDENNYSKLTRVPEVSPSWLSNASGLFENCKALLSDVGKWDVSHFTNMSNMFKNCHFMNFNLNDWNTENVTNMSGMFENCYRFEMMCGDWNVSNVKDTSNMFKNVGNEALLPDEPLIVYDDLALLKGYYASKETVDNHPNIKLNVISQPTAEELTAEDMEIESSIGGSVVMLSNYTGELALQLVGKSDIDYWDVEIDNITILNAGNFVISGVKIDALGLMGSIDIRNKLPDDLDGLVLGRIKIDDPDFFKKIDSPFRKMLALDMIDAPDIDIVDLKLNNITKLGLRQSVFRNVILKDVESMPQNLTDASYAFMDLTVKGEFDISGIDFSKVEFFTQAFSNLKIDPKYHSQITNIDTSSAIDVRYMYSHIPNFNGDISKLNVSNVESFTGMLAGLPLFNRDISGWDVSSGTNFDYMLLDSTSFDYDLSNWCVEKVTKEPLRFAPHLPKEKTPNWGAECHIKL